MFQWASLEVLHVRDFYFTRGHHFGGFGCHENDNAGLHDGHGRTQVSTSVYLPEVNTVRWLLNLIPSQAIACSNFFRLSGEAIDVCWNLLGTIWVFGGNMRCPEAPYAVYFIKRKPFSFRH